MKAALALLALTLLACGGKHKATPAAPAAALIPATITLQLLNGTASVVQGTQLTFFATVTADATGTVTFLDGSTVLATPAVGGTAASWGGSLSTILAPGVHVLTATYSGDASYATATTPEPLTVVVVPAGVPTVTLIASVNPSTLNAAVTFTATVSYGPDVPNAAITGVGVVTFLDGATALDGIAQVANGVATGTVSSLKAGTHVITAVFTPALTPTPTYASTPLSEVITGS